MAESELQNGGSGCGAWEKTDQVCAETNFGTVIIEGVSPQTLTFALEQYHLCGDNSALGLADTPYNGRQIIYPEHIII